MAVGSGVVVSHLTCVESSIGEGNWGRTYTTGELPVIQITFENDQPTFFQLVKETGGHVE